jgi:SAM-dependent methyltransferase
MEMTPDSSDPVINAFFALHEALPRQGPGSDDTTRRLLELAAPPPGPRALDLGCGPGRASLVLAEAGADVTALDLYQPYLDALQAAAAWHGVAARIHPVCASMADPPFPDGSFELLWAEGSA